jgi:hypothetical protein
MHYNRKVSGKITTSLILESVNSCKPRECILNNLDIYLVEVERKISLGWKCRIFKSHWTVVSFHVPINVQVSQWRMGLHL